MAPRSRRFALAGVLCSAALALVACDGGSTREPNVSYMTPEAIEGTSRELPPELLARFDTEVWRGYTLEQKFEAANAFFDVNPSGDGLRSNSTVHAPVASYEASSAELELRALAGDPYLDETTRRNLAIQLAEVVTLAEHPISRELTFEPLVAELRGISRPFSIGRFDDVVAYSSGINVYEPVAGEAFSGVTLQGVWYEDETSPGVRSARVLAFSEGFGWRIVSTLPLSQVGDPFADDTLPVAYTPGEPTESPTPP